ncbi:MULTISPECIES: hypothetical protein [unclassified Streptomyces]|uniref:hypothetical protein n=1 Tax=unclassified Streptomyces TaxID=2593676 RepID=UPI0033A4BC5F
MPFTLPPRTPPGPRRRSLLASAAGALALAGCSAPESDSDTTGSKRSASDRARARAARDSETLAARYTAVIAAHPPLAARLDPLRAEVLRHAKAFTTGLRTSATPSASASRSGAAAPSASASAAVPEREKDALAELAATERTLADKRARDLLELPGETARLLASVAAAGAAHAYLLTEDGK